MGEAFDRMGQFLGAVEGDSKREVLDQLEKKFGELAHEIRIRSVASAELPRYRSHKEVWGLKIASIEFDSYKARQEGRETDGSAMLLPEDPGYGPISVDGAYVRKHEPKPGGYYVIYQDGYKSFSPAEAFEQGYSRIR